MIFTIFVRQLLLKSWPERARNYLAFSRFAKYVALFMVYQTGCYRRTIKNVSNGTEGKEERCSTRR